MKCLKGYLFLLVCILVLSGCTYLESAQEPSGDPSGNRSPVAFNPPGQFTASGPLLYSDLSPSGRPGAAPVLDLSTDATLTLLFETEGFDSGEYILSFTHHNPDWSRSSLPPEFFLDGLFEIYLSGGELNRNDPFRYRQFTYRFPNRDVRFRVSGNYMLRISDSQTGNLLFTLPFFVSENEGSLRAFTEQVLRAGNGRRFIHRPVAFFKAPDFVEMPQFDLQVLFSQNRYWGLTKVAGETDFSGNAEARFELKSGDSFNGNFAAAAIDIRTLSQLEQDIDDLNPTQVPVTVQIDEDVENLYADDGVSFPVPLSGALRTADAVYADASFYFELRSGLNENQSVYLAGDFNNWHIEEKLKLGEPDNAGLRSVSVRIKQGRYRYKYILFDGEKFDLSRFENDFSGQRQDYHAFVYFRDPQTQSYRLLNVLNFRGPG